MSNRGVFAVDRGIWEDPDFAKEPFTEREAFLWLVGEAAWKKCRRRGSVKAVDLERGQLCHSIRFMADAWQWSKSRVDRFLKRLIKTGMLSCEKRDSECVYSISKYNEFQRTGLPSRDTGGTRAGQDRDTSGTEAGHERDKLETDKHSNIETDIAPNGARGTTARNEEREAFDHWNLVAAKHDLPKAEKLTDTRRRSLRHRMAEAGGLDGWKATLDRIGSSSFLTGRKTGFRADFDFILQAKSFTKLIEGAYDDAKPKVVPLFGVAAAKAQEAPHGRDERGVPLTDRGYPVDRDPWAFVH